MFFLAFLITILLLILAMVVFASGIIAVVENALQNATFLELPIGDIEIGQSREIDNSLLETEGDTIVASYKLLDNSYFNVAVYQRIHLGENTSIWQRIS